MGMLPSWLERYRLLPRAVFLLAAAQFLINLVNSTQFLLLNLFLKSLGLADPAIAALGAKRFVAVFALSIPAGLWLRGRQLRWPLVISAAVFPLCALAGIEFARLGRMDFAAYGFLAMGFASLVLNVAGLPFVLRVVKQEQVGEALSLLFACWAASAICGGALSSGLQWLGAIPWGAGRLALDEHTTLLMMTVCGLGAPFFLARLPDPPPQSRHRHWLEVHREDMPRLLRALVPTVCIATGAGLSIQFMNLFFSNVHHLGPAAYAGWGTVSQFLVLGAGLLVPEVRRKFGWRGGILGVQSVAVLLLLAMGFTEWGAPATWALVAAVLLFVLRQPLMSMAGPATSELTMSYVGPRNHELVSACNGAIWSGSWWLAAKIFEHLRAGGLPYWQVFLATSLLYVAGTWSYLGIIRTVDAAADRGGTPRETDALSQGSPAPPSPVPPR